MKTLLLPHPMLLALLLLLSGALISCDPERENPPPDVPEGSAAFHEGEVLAPGANIMTRGQVYEDSAPAGGATLFALERGGEVFLYHPAMGQVELSEETSREAIGYFVLYPGSASPATAQALTSIAEGQTEVTNTGLEITSDPDAVNILTVKSNAMRWSAIEPDNSPQPLFLKPGGPQIPTSLYEAAVDDFKIGEAHDIATSERVVAPLRSMNTYGSIVRAFPIVLATAEGRARVAEAREANSELFTALNALDLAYILISGTEQIIGQIPIECVEQIAIAQLRSRIDTMANQALSEGLTLDAYRQLQPNIFNRDLQLFIGCTKEAALGLFTGFTGTIAYEAMNFFLDTIGFMNYIVGDLLWGIWDTATLDAFDVVEIELPDDKPILYDFQVIGDLYNQKPTRVRVEIELSQAEEVNVWCGVKFGCEEDYIKIPAEETDPITWAVEMDITPEGGYGPWPGDATFIFDATSKTGETLQRSIKVPIYEFMHLEGTMVTTSRAVFSDTYAPLECSHEMPFALDYDYKGDETPAHVTATYRTEPTVLTVAGDELELRCFASGEDDPHTYTAAVSGGMFELYLFPEFFTDPAPTQATPVMGTGTHVYEGVTTTDFGAVPYTITTTVQFTASVVDPPPFVFEE